MNNEPNYQASSFKMNARSILLYLMFALLPFSFSAPTRPTSSSRGTLKFSYEKDITRVTIDHPPINLFDFDLASDFLDFLVSIQPNQNASRSSPKVVIVDSADPDFFISHIDMTSLLAPLSARNLTFIEKLGDIGGFLRNTTTSVFIAELNGRFTGFGDEIPLQMDIRIAGPNTRGSQLETAVGVFPGGGGSVALPSQITRGRALQYILTNEAADGPTGTRIGWYNEYHSTTAELSARVNALAKYISRQSISAINGTKVGIAPAYPRKSIYEKDVEAFIAAVSTPEGQRLTKKFIELSDGQTRNGFELDIPESLVQLQM